MNNINEEEKIKYAPYLRLDKGKLDKFEIIICGYLLLPIRFFGVLFSLLTLLSSLYIYN